MLLGSLAELTGTLLLVAVSYLLPAATIRVLDEERVGAGFDVGALRTATVDRDYLVPWVLATWVGLVLGAVVMALAATGVGLVAVPFVVFYHQVAVLWLYGRGYRSAVEEDDGPDPADGAVAAGGSGTGR